MFCIAFLGAGLWTDKLQRHVTILEFYTEYTYLSTNTRIVWAYKLGKENQQGEVARKYLPLQLKSIENFE